MPASDPKAELAVKQEMGWAPADVKVPDGDSKCPHEWAIAKGLLKLNVDGSIHYATHTPWQYNCARVMKKWPDPAVDPTFKITEAEFDAAIKAIS